MQLTKKEHIIIFNTREGELNISRREYEALKEIFRIHKHEIPSWNEISKWCEARIG